MRSRTLAFFSVAMAAAAGSVHAQPPGIEHEGVACIIVAKYPKLKACFGGEVVEPRANFHEKGASTWYFVKMVPDATVAPEPFCYVGILPKPSRKLIDRHIEYYLEDVGKGQRTREFDPRVVRRAQECQKDAAVAPISPSGPVAVFPAVPAGFTISGFPTAVVGVGTAAAVGTGVYFATRDDEPTPVQTPTPPPPAPQPPNPPAPGYHPPLPSPLELSCRAEPRSGEVPLTVTFLAFPSGGTGGYNYDWQFGDGASASSRHPVHTYTSRGTFNSVLTVTSGDQVRTCERAITVNAPPRPSPSPSPSPSPTPTPTVTLTFTSQDNTGEECGRPVITISPPTPPSNCGTTGEPVTTCTHTYVVGTVVNLSYDADLGCESVCWSGACASVVAPPDSDSTCTLTMDTDKVAGARFEFGSCFAAPLVSLAWSIDLDAPGAIGQAVVDGQVVVAASGQRAQQMVRRRDGEVVVMAHLVKADGKPGTWRFEAQQGESIEPGSLRVLQGDVAVLTPTAVAFRLKGTAGERVAFSYRLRR